LCKHIGGAAPLGGEFCQLVLLLWCERYFHKGSLGALFLTVNGPKESIPTPLIQSILAWRLAQSNC
jgi:hypothetical protein